MSGVNLGLSKETIMPLNLAREPFVSYSQNGEDVMLNRALSGVKSGFYVDVGAAEPEADSVTFAFYKNGWRGINLEPAVGSFNRLSSLRPRDINLNVAVGDRNGIVDFFSVDGGNGLSTTIPQQMEILKINGWNGTINPVPLLTLSSILEKYAEKEVHFLKIDVEGSERAVLAGAELSRYRPWIILIEATKPNSQEATHQDWEDLLVDANYHFAWFDGLNRFYVSAERLELMSAFRVQPNVFDNFIRYAELEAHMQIEQMRTNIAEAARREQQACDALKMAEANIVEQQRREDKLREELLRLAIERDAWMQELFESNRYCADLVQTRQMLLDDKQRLEGEKVQMHNQIQAMYASTSWKFSRPVRAFGKLLGRR